MLARSSLLRPSPSCTDLPAPQRPSGPSVIVALREEIKRGTQKEKGRQKEGVRREERVFEEEDVAEAWKDEGPRGRRRRRGRREHGAREVRKTCPSLHDPVHSLPTVLTITN